MGQSTSREVDVAAAGEEVGAVSDAGSISRLPMSADRRRPTAEGAVVLTGDSPGLEGGAEPGDRFGEGLVSRR